MHSHVALVLLVSSTVSSCAALPINRAYARVGVHQPALSARDALNLVDLETVDARVDSDSTSVSQRRDDEVLRYILDPPIRGQPDMLGLGGSADPGDHDVDKTSRRVSAKRFGLPDNLTVDLVPEVLGHAVSLSTSTS
ncbi:hypothetical protein FA95DRAFT_770942 [Auriscalpium vulgare]|uniref:Uncharacterized protein n=1 Tax=Auriscalpium vulgare TaxID=40419 RepID=A0ACB8RBY7_9AGAM|nr:hypothetical protein FA95DRAFT_770942 [Auriscalpium vulgare]